MYATQTLGPSGDAKTHQQHGTLLAPLGHELARKFLGCGQIEETNPPSKSSISMVLYQQVRIWEVGPRWPRRLRISSPNLADRK